MIHQNTIDKVKETVNIVEVISDFIKLNKQGQNYITTCPFHEEKTPSFSVSGSKQIYKCFGCNRSGDAIQFVMEHTQKPFIEAIEWLASFYNIYIEREEETERTKKERESLESLQSLAKATAKLYTETFHKYCDDKAKGSKLMSEIFKRDLDKETLTLWQIGYSPDEWNFLSSKIIADGKFQEGSSLGLIKTKNDRTFDFFRNRLMFPVTDNNGLHVGFGGRDMSGNAESAKYLNSIESKLYNKSKILYGLFQAIPHIQRSGKAILTEGYFDVISLHQEASRMLDKIEEENERCLNDPGAENTNRQALIDQKEERLKEIISNTAVATCGTSITDQQAQLIGRYTDHIILFFDGDSAGKIATWKALDVFLNLDFHVEVCWLPEGQDPDSICRKAKGQVNKYIHDNAKDALMEKANMLLESAEAPNEKEKVIEQICLSLTRISSDIRREEYIKQVAIQHKIRIALLREKIDQISQMDAEIKDKKKLKKAGEVDTEAFQYEIPKEVKRNYEELKDDIHRYGFFEYSNKYYMMRTRVTNGNKKSYFVPVSNFIIKILQHMEDEKMPMKLVEIINSKGRKRTFETPSENFVSIISFKKMCTGKGNYHWTGNSVDLERVVGKLYEEMGDGRMIRVLGWQVEEQIFCFNNGFFFDQFYPYNKHGCFEFNNKNFYVPSANRVYASNNGIYLNQKRVIFHNNGLTFCEWAMQVKLVHREHGMLAIMFGISCLFSDFIFSKLNFFPILFLYGEPSTGKGNLIRCIQGLFGTPQNALTITGKANTDKAKIRKFAQFTNMVICMEEFRNSVGDDIIQMLKGFYDRFGYERGNLDSEFGTDTVPINSAVIITGNDYPLDDALVTRLTIEEMTKDEFNQEEKDNFHKLKDMLDAGISAVTGELLLDRKKVEGGFSSAFAQEEKEFLKKLQDCPMPSRMISNISVFSAIYKVFDNIKFPFSHEELKDYLYKLITKQNSKRDTGGEIQKFWDVFLYNVRNKRLTHGREFKIDGDELTIQFKEVYLGYMEAHSHLYKTSGHTHSTMLDKLKKWNGYIEHKPSVRFGERRTSAKCFSYDKCKIPLRENIEDLGGSIIY